MKVLCYLLGLVCIIIAVVYFVIPADQLPGFMPGHQAGVMRVHVKHGVVAGGAGVVLFIIGWVLGRRA